MKCTILLHSATGNTSLVAGFISRRLSDAGHLCTLHDVVATPEPPDLTDVDFLGVASPTNYFDQSRVMRRFLERLPAREGEPRPAFLVATCGGETGAHFASQADQLQRRGWLTLGTRAVAFPDSWPPHRALTRPLGFTAALGHAIGAKLSPLRLLLSVPYPDVSQPNHRTVSRLGRFVDRVSRRAAVRDLLTAQSPDALAAERPAALVRMGRSMRLAWIRRCTDIHIDPHRCSRCGTCVALCPSGCLSRDGDHSVPQVGTTCVGCWACYQHCPEHAISGWHAPAEKGRYSGPPAPVVEAFQARWLE